MQEDIWERIFDSEKKLENDKYSILIKESWYLDK